MQVLTVDDSATMRRILRNQLRQAGVDQVDEAANGREALALLARRHYDLLITDWNMPEMCGLDLVVEVRRTEGIRQIPILMITTVSAKEDIMNALKAGVSNYIVKPFDAATLHAKIAQLVPLDVPLVGAP
ncbi:MAG TPA: response regulator [Terriglobales bacterium]|nr:response regulator [Terriglobales bacterium]